MTVFELKSADSTTLKGRAFAPPENPIAVVSLIHGFGEHSGRYQDMADVFRAHGIAVVAVDLRGHGHSYGTRGVCHDYERMHEDLLALIHYTRSQYRSVPHFLYGHSMGGGLVMHHGFNRSDVKLKAIIATAPLLRLPKPPNFVVSMAARLMRKFKPDMVLKNPINGSTVSTIPEEQEKYENDPLNHGSLGIGLAVDMVDNGKRLIKRAGEWDTPLLLMHAKGDRLTAFSGSEAFAADAHQCRFITFDGVEHEIHNDTSRADVYAHMANFIKEFL